MYLITLLIARKEDPDLLVVFFILRQFSPFLIFYNSYESLLLYYNLYYTMESTF